MSTDYDAPRRRPGDVDDDEPAVPVKKNDSASADLQDDTAALETLELPDAELLDETLEVKVVPKQSDEFTCTSCWMVRHKSQREEPGADVCKDCA